MSSRNPRIIRAAKARPAAELQYDVHIPAYPPGFSAPVALIDDPILRQHSMEVLKFGTPELKKLVLDTFLAMRERQGTSMSAVQIGMPVRVIVWDCPGAPFIPSRGYAVNPEIVAKTAQGTRQLEGCLSVPGTRGQVTRHDSVRVQAYDANGRPITLEAGGLWARRLQHELDHLNGILYTDHLLSRERRSVLRIMKRRLGIPKTPPECG